MNECKIENHTEVSSYEELIEAMGDDLYWVRFFARPCCPAPDVEGAAAMLDRLAGEVDANDQFTPSQKQKLREAIESRKEWYPKSGLCRARRNA